MTDLTIRAMHKGLPTLPVSRDRLRDGSVRLKAELDLPGEWGPVGFELRGPPRVDVAVEESQGGGIDLRGTLTTPLVETCSRCLKTVERDREVEIDLRFEPGLDPWDEGPGLYVLDANREELDVGPALREELILALPDYPLCRSDCRGLCPRCGQDLNDGECDCAEETGDPRWEALRRQLTPDTEPNDDERQDG